jgi:5'-nucleotidase
MHMKKIIYIDMDNVLVDFKSGIDKLDQETIRTYEGRLDEVPGIFEKMKPLPGAIGAANDLAKTYDVYILSTAPWLNPSAWIHKVQWVQKHFGVEESSPFYKRLIISHHKNLNSGDYLIDDRPNNGAKDFEGEWLHFGSESFPDWESVTKHLL